MNVPSWANNMIRNYRKQAQIPKTITDEELYKIIQEEIELLEDPKEQVAVLRSYFNLEPSI